jgi:hypothetical protein
MPLCFVMLSLAVIPSPSAAAHDVAHDLQATAGLVAHGKVPIFNLEIGQRGELSPDAVEMLRRAGLSAIRGLDRHFAEGQRGDAVDSAQQP